MIKSRFVCQGEHDHAQFTHMHMLGPGAFFSFSVEALI